MKMGCLHVNKRVRHMQVDARSIKAVDRGDPKEQKYSKDMQWLRPNTKHLLQTLNVILSIFLKHVVVPGMLELIPVAIGLKRRYTLDRLPVHHRAPNTTYSKLKPQWYFLLDQFMRHRIKKKSARTSQSKKHCLFNSVNLVSKRKVCTNPLDFVTVKNKHLLAPVLTWRVRSTL